MPNGPSAPFTVTRLITRLSTELVKSFLESQIVESKANFEVRNLELIQNIHALYDHRSTYTDAVDTHLSVALKNGLSYVMLTLKETDQSLNAIFANLLNWLQDIAYPFSLRFGSPFQLPTVGDIDGINQDERDRAQALKALQGRATLRFEQERDSSKSPVVTQFMFDELLNIYIIYPKLTQNNKSMDLGLS